MRLIEESIISVHLEKKQWHGHILRYFKTAQTCILFWDLSVKPGVSVLKKYQMKR